MRTVIALLLVCLFSPLAFAQDDKQAVCKDSKIPADRVAVSEYHSDGCSPPDTNNAWDTVVPKDGTIICQKRDIESTARVLELELCEEVLSNSCPAKLDGTANAFVLRSPMSCLAQKETRLRLQCVSGTQGRVGPTEVVIGITNTEGCKPADPRFFGNAFLVGKRLDPYSVVKMCWYDTRDEPASISDYELQWNDVILRYFHSDYCRITKPDLRFNTVMVTRLRKRPIPTMLLCRGTPMVFPFIKNTSSEYTPPFVRYRAPEVEPLYTPLCGVDEQAKPNAKRVLAPTDASGQDDNPWK